MICFRCDSEAFDLKENMPVLQEYKGHKLIVKVPGMVCHDCGLETLGLGQLDALLKETKKAYEEKVTRENRLRSS